jgi:cell wall-associated NlpC family hydrolase
MTGRDTMPRHYAAALVALLLAACASTPTVEVTEASEPVPLRGPRTSAATPLDLRADDLLMRAMGLIGTPYRYGGTTPQRGFDCSGFTSYVFRESVGVELPRTANDQFLQAGTTVAQHDLAAGDLVFFRQGRGRIDHVGIYVGEGRFIHSPSRGGRVRIDALAAPHWTRSYKGAKRLLRAAP